MIFLKCKIRFIYVGNHLKFQFWLFETLPNLTSIFVPNCISKNCQISSKHQPQNIGQISISKSWLNPVLHVWTKLQLKKVTKNSALISWPNFSFSTKLSLIRSSSTLTSFQLAFLHTRVTSVKFGTERQTRQCNDQIWIW